VDAGRARTSRLMWHLFGTNTSRPWDRSKTPAKANNLKPMPPPGKGTPLNDEELRTCVQWIDLGAQYEAVKANEPPVAAAGEAQVK